ncbi:peptidase M48 Ste24p [Thalassoporum mexicanum PCC 7367]|uniref:M48 family metallopeptidase n=1 Tax=Thalassoporum mexicanum TaxID=3457544 RepID=UPI00029FDBDE|nr:M48 family metallopeptidase [Pseudanabaena sp. PCC 7367]AFY69484.1 peptidase M48 Ste24p [Pseudanabaena sp. PCC 7367]
MKYVPPPIIPEDINVSKVNPLKQMGELLLSLVITVLAIYIILGIAADFLVGHMSPERELAIGKSFIASTLATSELKGDPRTPYVNELAVSLAASTDLEPERQAIIEIFLINNPQVNAAAFPGGQLIVTRGLLEQVESENELSFVLGHEIGHFAARDSLRAMGRSLVFAVILSNLGMSGSGASTVSRVGQFTELTYRRGQETAADEYALEAVIDRYGHGGHSLDFFENIKKLELGPDQLKRVAGYFSTHPMTQARIDRLNQIAAENNWPMQGEPTNPAIDLSASAPRPQVFPI